MNTSNDSTSDADVLDRIEDKDSAARVQSLLDEAVALRRAGNFRDALRVFQLALDTQRHVLDGRSDDNISALILHDIGVTCIQDGQYDAALAASSKAVQIWRRVCAGVDDERVALGLYRIGVAFQRLDCAGDALLQFTESLEMRRRLANGADNEHLARSMRAVGRTLMSLYRLDEALPHLRGALAMQRCLSDGRDYEELAAAMANLSVTLAHLGRDPEEVRSLIEESLAMQRRLVGGKDDENLAISIGNMGAEKVRQRDLDSALELYIESYEMLMRLFPTGHRVAAYDLCKAGCVLLTKEETRDEGEKKIDEGLAMFRRLVGNFVEHTICLGDCGDALKDIGRVEKGEQLRKEAEEMSKRVAEVADVATAAAAFSTTTPAQQVDMSDISHSNYPQPRSETQPTTATDYTETLVIGGAWLPSSVESPSSTDS